VSELFFCSPIEELLRLVHWFVVERLRPMRLLITERDPLVREWLGRRAAELGVDMTFARSSGEALRVIGARAPDCVVLDACTGAEDDAPLWSQLRKDPGTRHIPVLLYSSSRRWQRVAELAGAELDGFVPRPFTTDALLDAAYRATTRRATA
jgi:CheY-like chemotaxis protein